MSARPINRRALTALGVVCAVVVLCTGMAYAANPFVDIANNSHAADIDATYNAGITPGCKDATHFCPADFVPRDQMATFLARTAGLSSGTTKHFPVVNAKGPTQAYCALVAANPSAFEATACQTAINTVDSTGVVGQFTSMALGTDGLPVISYFDQTNGDLKVARCINAVCSTTATVTALDTTGVVGQYTSIAIGSDGFPLVSYYDDTNDDLKVAHCTNAACTAGATVTRVDSTGNVGPYSSIAIGGDGLPVISYFDVTNGDLKVARCTGVACTAPTLTVVDSVGNVGAYTSMVMGPDGLPIISYQEAGYGDLKVAHCTKPACTAPTTIVTVDNPGNVGRYSSIAIGTDGLPVVSYYDDTNHDLKIAHCANLNCSTGTVVTAVDTAEDVGSFSSIAIGTDGLPLIAEYSVTSGNLRLVHCGNVVCNLGIVRSTIESSGDVGQGGAIVVGIDGVVISYTDVTRGDLKVARPPVV